MISRPEYLKKIVRYKDKDLIKVITGMRRVGKSVLLFEIFADFLRQNDVADDHILRVNLETPENMELRNANKLYDFLTAKMVDERNKYYVMIDEIQYVDGFEDLVNGLKNRGADVYITGSNSKLLSGDINTALRGRSIEIRVFPLSFKEYHNYKNGDINVDFREYMLYGGLPYVATAETEIEKTEYLKMIGDVVATRDIVERYDIKTQNVDAFSAVADFLYSNIGALVSARKITNALNSGGHKSITADTVGNYLSYLTDAFLFYKAMRYDIKGKDYLKTIQKYYSADLGVRNSHLNFRQIEPTHALENLVFLELLNRGYSVDVGINGDKEVDFVANRGAERQYIQVAYSITDESKRFAELASFKKIDDGYAKIVLTMDNDPFIDLGDGYQKVNVVDWLLG